MKKKVVEIPSIPLDFRKMVDELASQPRKTWLPQCSIEEARYAMSKGIGASRLGMIMDKKYPNVRTKGAWCRHCEIILQRAKKLPKP